MKYQRLLDLESQWKLQYILNRHQQGVQLFALATPDDCQLAFAELEKIALDDPTQIESWIEHYLHPDWHKKLNQAIRARRKRFHNLETKAN